MQIIISRKLIGNMIKFTLKKLAILAVTLLVSSSALAQSSTNRINTETDWSVFQEGKECWIVSTPKRTTITRNGKPVTANRSDILLFVTYNKSRGILGEVAFTAGYSLKANTPVKLKVGSAEYTLVPEGEWAWPATTETSRKIRSSMRRGANAVITGNSSRGKITTDTFSLKGFSAALLAAEKRCG